MYKGHAFNWLCNASTHLAGSFVIKLQSNSGCMRHLSLIMYVWHIDSHHKLIRWGIVIHGMIDGFCQTVRTHLSLYVYLCSRHYVGGWPTGQYRQPCTNSPWPFPHCHRNLWNPFMGPWESWWREYRCCCLDDPTSWSQPILLLVGAINLKLSH